MKKAFLFSAIFTLSAIQMGCFNQAPIEQTVTLPTRTLLYGADDLSTTHTSAQKMSPSLLLSLARLFLNQKHEVTVFSTHVSQKQPNPVTLELKPFTGSLKTMSIQYKEELQQKILVDSLNETATIQFKVDFDEHISNFELIRGKTDYSYINVHARAIAHFLKGDSTTQRIAIISTDFIDDLPKKKAAFMNETIIQLLNESLATPYSHLFVITTAPVESTALKDLNATFVSSFTEFKIRVETLFSSPNLVSKS